jgi:hypothetical protein
MTRTGGRIHASFDMNLAHGIGQFALPPSQKEAKAKHWWQFWR